MEKPDRIAFVKEEEWYGDFFVVGGDPPGQPNKDHETTLTMALVPCDGPDDKGARRVAEIIARELGTVCSGLPRVVTLCGSTRFRPHFEYVNQLLTLQGVAVFSCGVWGSVTTSAQPDTVRRTVTEQEKAKLDELHLRKIDMSDYIVVIDVGGYVGESTQREIEYALSKGKPVAWWSKDIDLMEPTPDTEREYGALVKFWSGA